MSGHTREEMLAIVRRGESVFHGEGMHRRIVSREEDVPSEVELAGNDKDALQAARAALVTQRDRLDAAIADIDRDLASQSPAKGKKGGKNAAETGTETASGTPPEAGDDNPRSQAAATVGTANSDGEAAASPPLQG